MASNENLRGVGDEENSSADEDPGELLADQAQFLNMLYNTNENVTDEGLENAPSTSGSGGVDPLLRSFPGATTSLRETLNILNSVWIPLNTSALVHAVSSQPYDRRRSLNVALRIPAYPSSEDDCSENFNSDIEASDSEGRSAGTKHSYDDSSSNSEMGTKRAKYDKVNTCFQKIEYKLELNLQKMTLTKIALSLWEKDEVRAKISQYFLNYYYFQESTKRISTKWYNITKMVLESLDMSRLPRMIISMLVHTIKSIGFTIFSWYEYVTRYLNFTLKDVQQIYWTNYGTIDKIKIFKSNWCRNGVLSLNRRFKIACEYCLVEEINYLHAQFSPDEWASLFQHNIYSDDSFCLVAYWKNQIDGDLPNLMGKFVANSQSVSHVYDLSRSIEENIFKASVYEGYEEAVKYFWVKLSEEEKERNLVPMASLVAECELAPASFGNHFNETSASITTFLLTEMSAIEQQKYYLANRTYFPHCLLDFWHWEDYFLLALDQLWTNVTENDYKSCIIRYLVAKVNAEHSLGCAIENSQFRTILHATWNKSPSRFKMCVDKRNWEILSILFQMKDFQTMNLIINDPCNKNRKQQLIDNGHRYFSNAIKSNNYKLLDQFMDKMLITDEEKLSFKSKFDMGKTFIEEGKYDLATQFLNWRFDSETEIKAFKANLISDQFSYEIIFTLWSTENVKSATLKSTQYLEWLSDSEEEILEFKRGCVVKSLDFVKNSMIEEHFGVMEEFLTWCTNPPDLIQNLKQDISESSLLLICKNFLNFKKFHVVEKYVHWCLGEMEKQKFVKTLMLADEGVQACNSLLNTVKTYKWGMFAEQQVLRFKNLLKILCGSDIIEIFKKEFRLILQGRMCDSKIETIMKLLDNLEKPDYEFLKLLLIVDPTKKM